MQNNNIYKSNEIQEPKWLLRWGTILVVLFFMGLLSLAWIFRYNEVIEGKVVITSENPPVNIKVEQTGTLRRKHYVIGDIVEAGAVLAIVKNQADEKDVFLLKKKLQGHSLIIDSIETIHKEFPFNLKLGASIHPFYLKYIETYQKVLMNESVRNDLLRQEQVLLELSVQESYVEQKREELKGTELQLHLYKKNYERHKNLYEKGIISAKEFEEIEREFHSANRQQQVSNQIYFEARSKHRQLLNANTITEQHKREYEKVNIAELALAKQDLMNAILQWEFNFIIRSPISGRISYLDIWGENHNVSAGDIISTVVPFDQSRLIGKSIVPIRNSGKLRAGQKSILKIENYPHKEWGVINATVHSISEIPKATSEKGFLVYFNVDSLTTSHGRVLEFNQDLSGTAEILIDEVSVLERIFYQLRAVFMKREI